MGQETQCNKLLTKAETVTLTRDLVRQGHETFNEIFLISGCMIFRVKKLKETNKQSCIVVLLPTRSRDLDLSRLQYWLETHWSIEFVDPKNHGNTKSSSLQLVYNQTIGKIEIEVGEIMASLRHVKFQFRKFDFQAYEFWLPYFWFPYSPPLLPCMLVKALFACSWSALSRIQHLLFRPHVKPSIGSRAFRVAAPSVWNSLPLHVIQSPSNDILGLKSRHIFSQWKLALAFKHLRFDIVGPDTAEEWAGILKACSIVELIVSFTFKNRSKKYAWNVRPGETR